MMGVGQGNWGGNGVMGGDLHQPGVMRRGGRMNNRSGGPYERRGRYNNQGGGGGGGRLSPRGMYGAPGRLPGNNPGAAAAFVPAGHPAAAMMMNAGFPDANAGPAMPREAVQGRSLKSYEDLDAVGGAGGGELNY